MRSRLRGCGGSGVTSNVSNDASPPPANRTPSPAIKAQPSAAVTAIAATPPFTRSRRAIPNATRCLLFIGLL
jgi:hypothetical protein